ncbi:HRD3A [Scenedesmus sp. PABB004]|nr:HRD3A [Scenedesmus sp. PABB004]
MRAQRRAPRASAAAWLALGLALACAAATAAAGGAAGGDGGPPVPDAAVPGDDDDGIALAGRLGERLALGEELLHGGGAAGMDVPGGLRLLVEVADALRAHTQPRAQSRTALRSRAHGLKAAGGAASGGAGPLARRARHGRRHAAAWRPLGRAGFILAALSASGLVAEHLPPPPPGAGDRDGDGDGAAQPPAAERRELQWLEAAARVGYVEAQLALADRYLLGRGGVAPSCPKGLAWLKQAAAAVLAQAEKASNMDAVADLVRLRERHVDAGSPAPPPDDAELGAELAADAALHGDAYSLRRLGYRKLIGRGMPADPTGALHDFVAAADGGDAYALYNLGYMALRGLAGPRDPQRAQAYFKRALERGVGAAANGLGVLAFHGADGGPPNVAAARRWFERGAGLSNAESHFNLGQLAAAGLGTPRDAGAALKHYERAYALGHWKAPYSIALLHLKDKAHGGAGYNCGAAERHLWQFVSSRSAWLDASAAALRDYDAAASPLAPAPPSHARTSALLRFLELAESGAEAAAANAAWALLRGEGAGGPRALAAAADMLQRSAMLNHTTSMLQLAQLLLDESVVLEPTQAGLAARAPPPPVAGATVAAGGGAAGGDSGGGAAASGGDGGGAAAGSASGPAGDAAAAGGGEPPPPPLAPQPRVPLLHQALLADPDAFMPPVGGATLATGRTRHALAPAARHVLTSCSSTGPCSDDGGGGGGSSGGDGGGGEAAAAAGAAAEGEAAGGRGVAALCALRVRARRAAVAWLAEASLLGDPEASVELAWLWARGEELPANGSKADALLARALGQAEDHMRAPVQVVAAVMRLERAAAAVLGRCAAWRAAAALARLRDAVARQSGQLPAVLHMRDGLQLPPAGAAARTTPSAAGAPPGSSAAKARHKRGGGNGGGGGVWGALGAADPDSVLLTILLASLAGVLLLRRQQQQAAAAGAYAGGRPAARDGGGGAQQPAAAAAAAPGGAAQQQPPGGAGAQG